MANTLWKNNELSLGKDQNDSNVSSFQVTLHHTETIVVY